MEVTRRIRIAGLVQGVGFRPFIYRLAHRHELRGWVLNRNDGVSVAVSGEEEAIGAFLRNIRREAPAASVIRSVRVEKVEYQFFGDFRIIRSEDQSVEITEVSPDIAVCEECLDDMHHQPRRVGYPLINCTHCGPRFSIIRELPYDRPLTTMAPFIMCNDCHKEYDDVGDRRFHAQPIACHLCGPQYRLVRGNTITEGIFDIVDTVAQMVGHGAILAIKGVGGYQLICDALQEDAVARLRLAKNREGKPFAVMFRSVRALQDYALMNRAEEELITSWRRPVVILRERKKLAPSVSNLFNTIGAMLPYMPFHYLLFERLKTPAIVFTSGNISDEPIVISDELAMERLAPLSAAVLSYNREIHNRIDDSVAMVVKRQERLVRRSRGYAPEPVGLKINAEGIIATGAELANCFCVGKGKQAILSQHIGDLKNAETWEFFAESLQRFKRLFRVDPSLVVHDMHPDYLSTRYAQSLGINTMAVQHHHAHIASCMTEHLLDEPVIGVALDGTGLGTDGRIWGGEFLLCRLDDFERKAHFEYIPLPGGDAAVKEPWKTGLSYLVRVFGPDCLRLGIPFTDQLNHEQAALIIQAISRRLNCPESSSAGRLFDAVSAILRICEVSRFHAEAPMRIESLCDRRVKEHYEFIPGPVISFDPAIRQIVNDIRNGIHPSVIAGRFHNTIIHCIFAVSRMIREETGIGNVVLSGGSFQNRIVLERSLDFLRRDGFRVFAHRRIPSNDGGIALGQLVIAAKRRSLGCV
ncbi:MAG: carbamoyltransferase HypF [Bacteroidales bacterium]|nr:carbamoyltransferase HypF [Bacteroidales bacterium]